MLLEFNGKRYAVFASSSADGSTATGAEAEAAQRQQGPPPLFAERAEELFCAPLRTFMQALRSHFGLHTDIVLSFPSLQLVFPLNLTFAEQLSLAHVERLHEAQAMAMATETESGDAGPLVMRLEDTGVSFIAQYNRLTRMLREGATQEDAIVLDEAEAEAEGEEGECAGDDGDDDDVVVVEAAALQTEEKPAEAVATADGEEEEEAAAEEAVVVVSDSEDAEAREKQKPLDTAEKATESERSEEKPIDGEQKEDEGSLLGEVDLEEVEAELGPTMATKVAQEEPDDNDDAGPAPIGDAGAINAGSISKESFSANPIAEDTAAEQPDESDALVSGADAQPSVDHKRGREDDAAEELGNDSLESKKARVAEEAETEAEALPAEDDVRAYNVDAAGDVVVEDELGAAVTVEMPDPAPAAESTTATQQGPGSGSGNGTSTAALEETATKDEDGEDDHFTDGIDGAAPALTPDAFLTGEEGVEEEAGDDDDGDALLLDDDAIATATATATATAAPSANVE